MNHRTLAGCGSIALALSLAASAQAATNLIVNGEFETPDANNGAYLKVLGGQNAGGWIVTGSDVLLIDRNYTESGLVFNAAAGNQAVDLTGAGNTSPENGVEQTVIGLIAGKTYKLRFELGNAAPIGGNAAVYTLPSTVWVSFDDGGPFSFTNSTNNPTGSPGINFQTYAMNYVATDTDVKVRFFNGAGNDNYAGVDNASLTAVPEPGAWALMILGFGAAGAVLRSKRSLALAA